MVVWRAMTAAMVGAISLFFCLNFYDFPPQKTILYFTVPMVPHPIEGKFVGTQNTCKKCILSPNSRIMYLFPNLALPNTGTHEGKLQF